MCLGLAVIEKHEKSKALLIFDTFYNIYIHAKLRTRNRGKFHYIQTTIMYSSHEK